MDLFKQNYFPNILEFKMEPPIPPNEADCCNSGCNPCILDVYEKQLKKYNARTGIAYDFKNCISETSYTVFKLVEKIRHTKDTYFLVFKYVKPYRSGNNEDKELKLYFKPGQHFLLRGCHTSAVDYFTRAYTPIPFENLGPLSFCVLVKIYEVGMMSRYLKNLKISSLSLWRGPYCDFTIDYKYKNILMIAQGTGIAPLYAIIREMLDNEDCESFIRLYFCCRSCDDILLREDLYGCLRYWNFNYEVFLSVSNFSCKYNEVIHNRRLTNDYVSDFLKDKNDGGTQVLICGSESFNKEKSLTVAQLDKIDLFVF